MDGEPASMAELEDEEPPEEEGEYWEDDELTPEELTAWFGTADAADGAGAAAGDFPGLEPDPRPAEGNVPDLIAAVLGAAGELRSTEELLRRRRPRVWDRRADRAEGRREELDGDQGVEVPERGMPA